MLTIVARYLSFLNTWFLSPVATSILLVAGAVLFYRLKEFKLYNPTVVARLMYDKTIEKRHNPIKALTLALAGTLGVGNISGVAVALAFGGAGAVFWMWISAFFAMTVKYSEIVLAVRFREKKNSTYHGGAMYYIKKGLNSKGSGRTLAFLFAVLCILSSLSTGSVIQVSAVSEAFKGCFGVPPIVVGILMALLCSWALCSKKKHMISDITIKLVPFMSGIFITLSMIIIIGNLKILPHIFGIIIEDAFTPDSAIGGIGGFFFSKGIRFGVTKGLFSNEAGCGTSTIAHASEDTISARSQGAWGIFEVFFDTIILCTMTALVLLICYGNNVPTTGGGVMVTLAAYHSSLGWVAKDTLAISIFLFAFATVICWAYYGCECVYFISKKPWLKYTYLSIYIISLIYGAVAPSSFIWELADSSICVMLTLNTLCVLFMSDKVVQITKNKDLVC